VIQLSPGPLWPGLFICAVLRTLFLSAPARQAVVDRFLSTPLRQPLQAHSKYAGDPRGTKDHAPDCSAHRKYGGCCAKPVPATSILLHVIEGCFRPIDLRGLRPKIITSKFYHDLRVRAKDHGPMSRLGQEWSPQGIVQSNRISEIVAGGSFLAIIGSTVIVPRFHLGARPRRPSQPACCLYSTTPIRE
jgi:hypothetical protein